MCLEHHHQDSRHGDDSMSCLLISGNYTWNLSYQSNRWFQNSMLRQEVPGIFNTQAACSRLLTPVVLLESSWPIRFECGLLLLVWGHSVLMRLPFQSLPAACSIFSTAGLSDRVQPGKGQGQTSHSLTSAVSEVMHLLYHHWKQSNVNKERLHGSILSWRPFPKSVVSNKKAT